MTFARFQPRALVFDMDGLLVDSEPLWFEVEREFATARGADWTPLLAATSKGVGIRSTIAFMSERFGFPVSIDEDAESVVDRFVARVSEVSLKPGAREILDGAQRGFGVALASSSCRRLIDATLHALGIANKFETVVSGDDVTRLKPDPDIFLLAASHLRVPPSGCLAFEDSLSGTTAAHAAGMAVISIPEVWPADPRFEAVADAVVASLSLAQSLFAPYTDDRGQT